MSSRVLLTGITADVVRRVRDEADGLPYLLNAAPAPWQRWTSRGADGLARAIRECGALGLNARHNLLTPLLARRLHEAGLLVSVWTVDGEREMRRMIRLGVDNITTRRVDRLLALRRERST
jgi:glycerophosphoryl diester phosphodiesterase